MKLDVKKTMNFLHSKGVKFPLRYLLLYEPERITKEDLDVKGDLDLINANIISLPKGLKVQGSLYLTNTPIETLPNKLEVKNSLILMNTGIETLPEDLIVDNWIYVDDGKISYFKKKYPQFNII